MRHVFFVEYIDANTIRVHTSRLDVHAGWSQALQVELKSRKGDWTQVLHLGTSQYPVLTTDIKLDPRHEASPASLDSPSSFPKNIFQTFKTAQVTRELYCSVQNILDRNPEYDYYFYDDEKCESFIEENCDSTVLQAFRALRCGAARADLWRLCVLQALGGVYCDLDLTPNVPFRDIIEFDGGDANGLLISDKVDGTIWNGLMVFKPRDEFLRMAIQTITRNVLNRVPGAARKVTGPEVLKDIFNRYLGRYHRGRIRPSDNNVSAKNGINYRIIGEKTLWGSYEKDQVRCGKSTIAHDSLFPYRKALLLNNVAHWTRAPLYVDQQDNSCDVTPVYIALGTFVAICFVLGIRERKSSLTKT